MRAFSPVIMAALTSTILLATPASAQTVAADCVKKLQAALSAIISDKPTRITRKTLIDGKLITEQVIEFIPPESYRITEKPAVSRSDKAFSDAFGKMDVDSIMMLGNEYFKNGKFDSKAESTDGKTEGARTAVFLFDREKYFAQSCDGNRITIEYDALAAPGPEFLKGKTEDEYRSAKRKSDRATFPAFGSTPPTGTAELGPDGRFTKLSHPVETSTGLRAGQTYEYTFEIVPELKLAKP